jgi:hypothetical protein
VWALSVLFGKLDLALVLQIIPQYFTRHIYLFFLTTSAAKNLQNGEDVAIKKVINPFDSVRDAKRILREIRILRHFSHDNVN